MRINLRYSLFAAIVSATSMSASLDQLPFCIAKIALLAALLCAGCISPFHRGRNCNPCDATVDASSCESPVDSDCEAKSCWHIHPCCCCYDAICCVCDWPCHACRRVVNFCVPEDVVGPSPVQGPGRFHPVPTHPV